MDDLFINSLGAYTTYKVRMGRGFIDAIEAGVPLKDPLENSSRLEHGVRMIVTRKKDKRNVTLSFNVHGRTKAEYLTNKAAFENALYNGVVTMQIAGRTEVYHLVYTGKSVTYKHSYNGVFGVITCGFVEPNPSNRTAQPNTNVITI